MKKKAANEGPVSKVFGPGKTDRCVTDDKGRSVEVPPNWDLVPPGDATLTRRIKAATAHWVIQTKRGRRTFSGGVWADAKTIAEIRDELEQHRQTPQYAKAQASAERRRTKVQNEYVEDFAGAVREYLNFHSAHQKIAESFVHAVTTHATPVGSGTVARTKRIPIEKRAEAAVIAWMRHQTTAYDHMVIARVKGKRREVRRMLAAESKKLLTQYRNGQSPPPQCPLRSALEK